MTTQGERGDVTTGNGGDADTISVAYVDDYDELCELTAEGLEDANERLAVETVTEPAAVLERLEEFDCVVADYAMPDLDGLELLRRVRMVDEELPFILYTGKGSEDVASEAISLGVTDYLAKRGGPERFARLAHRVENVVDARRATEAVTRTRRKARETVQRERARFRALIERSPATTVVLDEAGRFQFISPSVEDLLGYKPSALVGDSAFEYVHEADRERVLEEFQAGLANPDYRPTVEYRCRHADGSWRHLESRGVNRLDDPAVQGFIVNTQDVTERKRAAERLRYERALTDGLFAVVSSPLLVVDGDGTVLRANEAAVDLFGANESMLLDLSPTAIDVELLSTGGGDAPTPSGDGDPDPGDVAAPDDADRPTPDDADRSGMDRLGDVARATGRPVSGVEYDVTVPMGRVRFRASTAPVSDGTDAAAVVAVEYVDRAAAGDNKA